MTRRHLAILLWLTLLICAPLPFFLVEVGNQPIVATAQILLVTVALMVIEGSAGAVTLAAWMLGVQLLLGTIVFGMLSIIVVRALDKAIGKRVMPAIFTIVAVIFLVALTMPIYRTPFRTTGLHATLSEVFE